MNVWLKFLTVGVAIVGAAFAGLDLQAKCRCNGGGKFERRAARQERRACKRGMAATLYTPANNYNVSPTTPSNPYGDNVETFGATAPAATIETEIQWRCYGGRCYPVRVPVVRVPAAPQAKPVEPSPAPVAPQPQAKAEAVADTPRDENGVPTLEINLRPDQEPDGVAEAPSIAGDGWLPPVQAQAAEPVEQDAPRVELFAGHEASDPPVPE